MKNLTSRSLILLVLTLLNHTPVTGNSGTNLWLKAVKIAAANRLLVPGKIMTHIKILNKKGKVKKHNQIWTKVTYNQASRELDLEVFKYLKNEKDITAEFLKKAGSEKKKQENNDRTFDLGDNPFREKVQPEITYRDTGETEVVAGISCRIYSYKHIFKVKNKPITRVGRAWIEETSGFPVKAQFTLDPLPKKVKQFTQTITFDKNNAGQWFTNQITISGVGGFLFIKKYFSTTILFSDYFTRPE